MTSNNINVKICYFGDFRSDYARNRVIIRGLQENGVEILFSNTSVRGWRKFVDLWRKYRSLKREFDIIVVGYSDSRFMIPFVRLISHRLFSGQAGKKIVWDAFYSLYDSWVLDRRLVGPGSLKAKYYWFLDWLSCKLADLILLDTDAHISYFSKTFGIKNSKFIKVLVGTVDDMFYPKLIQKTSSNFLVHFHGNFIPLQGVEYIIRAASLLNDHNIQFQIIGQGQEYGKIKKIAEELNLKNITWIGYVAYEELSNYISKADICLGIFGKTEKTRRVIPNKAYEAIAMAKPLISADTPAMQELFTDRKDIMFCNLANSKDLADKILELKNNDNLRNEIAQSGYELFKEVAVPSRVVLPLVRFLRSTF